MAGHIMDWSAQDVVNLLSDVLDEREKDLIIRLDINGLVLKEFASQKFLVKVIGLSYRSASVLLLRFKDHLGITIVDTGADDSDYVRVSIPRRSFDSLGMHGAGDASETAWRRRRYRIRVLIRLILGE
ncbi:hypothetical protein COOONC_28566 [Cooperia oncophora]